MGAANQFSVGVVFQMAGGMPFYWWLWLRLPDVPEYYFPSIRIRCPPCLHFTSSHQSSVFSWFHEDTTDGWSKSFHLVTPDRSANRKVWFNPPLTLTLHQRRRHDRLTILSEVEVLPTLAILYWKRESPTRITSIPPPQTNHTVRQIFPFQFLFYQLKK